VKGSTPKSDGYLYKSEMLILSGRYNPGPNESGRYKSRFPKLKILENMERANLADSKLDRENLGSTDLDQTNLDIF